MILATTRGNEESHMENGLGFAMNPRRTNGQSLPTALSKLTDEYSVSGHDACAGIAHCNRGSGRTGER